MVVGIEQQGLDDTANAPGRIVGKALDLEPGARPESLAGEVGVVVDLMSQEPAVRRPEDELPGVEACLDDDVGGAQRDAVRAFLEDLSDAMRFYLERPREARQLLIDSKMVRVSPAVYLDMKDYYRDPTLRPDADALVKMQEFQVKAGFQKKSIDVRSLVDASYLPK